MFDNRSDAGRQLAQALDRFRQANPLVLALPRGGVVVGMEVARQLGCDMDVLLVKKLRAPGNPELAVGAISEDGHPYINEEVQRITGADKRYMNAEIQARLAEIADQQELYRKVKARILPAGRTVILVDDGLATGSTMIAAVQATSLAQPARTIVAVPVGSTDAAETLRSMPGVDEVICLDTPAWFAGVGQFYNDFTQVSDEEVAAILGEFA